MKLKITPVKLLVAYGLFSVTCLLTSARDSTDDTWSSADLEPELPSAAQSDSLRRVRGVAPRPPSTIQSDPILFHAVADRKSPEPLPDGFEALEESFLTQPIDTAWSDDAVQLARRHVEQSLPEASRLEAVECRSSLCRVETSHESAEDYQAWVDQIVLQLEDSEATWNGAVAVQRQRSERAAEVWSVSYLARSGVMIESMPIAGAKPTQRHRP